MAFFDEKFGYFEGFLRLTDQKWTKKGNNWCTGLPKYYDSNLNGSTSTIYVHLDDIVQNKLMQKKLF